MTTAIEEAEAQGVVQTNVKPTFGYYRQPNGWITVSTTTRFEKLKYQAEGWTFLGGYGAFEMSGVYMANHPLEGLLMQGGAKELTAEQIVDQGLWMNPPLVPTCRRLITQRHPRHGDECWEFPQAAEFPQVPESTPRFHACSICDSHYPTARARDQHTGVAHKDEQGDIRTGKTLADALGAALGGKTPVTAQGDASALDVLSGVGLNQKQIAALKAAGFEVSDDGS